jgi:hypothetical protein
VVLEEAAGRCGVRRWRGRWLLYGLEDALGALDLPGRCAWPSEGARVGKRNVVQCSFADRELFWLHPHSAYDGARLPASD